MKYNFDKVHDRKNTDSVKWNQCAKIFGREDVIPLWVADMDFPVAQPIVDALKKRAEHPFYGYVAPGASVIEAVVERMQHKFNWKIEPEWVVFTPGVVPALHIAVRTIAHPGDEIILQEPVYFPFFPAVTGSGCQIVNNQIKMEDGCYQMDYADLESKFRAGDGILFSPCRIKGIILCNPHNPVGRLWTREELIRLGKIIIGNGATVISDEIHCEILFKGFKHTPFASISKDFEQNCIVCMSPSKTFSLAGLEISTIIIPNQKLRNKFINTRMGLVPGPNVFGYTALEAAYRDSDDWLAQVLDYLQGNLDYMTQYFTEKIPRVKVIQPQGTYLIWLDCRELSLDNRALSDLFIQKAGVGLENGRMFGQGGSGFMRMNIACPRPLLEEALERIEKAVQEI